MKKYELIEHTADIGIRIFGKDYNELFANAAFGLFDHIADLSHIKCNHVEQITIKSTNIEELLVDWLNELLYLFSVKKYLFCQFSVTVEEKKNLKAIVKGVKLNPADLEKIIKLEIKAATYHGLKIEQRNNLFVGEVIFDV